MSRRFPGSIKARSMAEGLQVSVQQKSFDRSNITALPSTSSDDHHHRMKDHQATRSGSNPMFAALELGLQAIWPPMEDIREEFMLDEPGMFFVKDDPIQGKLCWGGFKLKIRNPSLRRLLSGAFAGAVSRTAVAPLETIRTHLMVGDAGNTVAGVFVHIMQSEGWQGLFRGNGINVIRVTPSKAIELFAYDTVKKALQPKAGEEKPKFLQFPLLLPVPTIAGAAAGVCSTLLTYPLELLKTRLTVQRGVYDNLMHAFVKIVQEEGPLELYRGLAPSLIGIIPYCGINYLAYEMLKKGYRKLRKEDRVGHLATLLIGSTAGVISSSATFPLEVARKHMQMGALNGRQVYGHVFEALQGIMAQQGVGGLYRGLGASCIKLVPAAGISFMCYEACKQILAEDD